MHPEIPAACFAHDARWKETLRVVLFVRRPAPRGSELLQRSSTLCPTSFRPGSRRQNETSKRSFRLLPAVLVRRPTAFPESSCLWLCNGFGHVLRHASRELRRFLHRRSRSGGGLPPS